MKDFGRQPEEKSEKNGWGFLATQNTKKRKERTFLDAARDGKEG